jgi:uncharacterized protein YgiM (DUF1202 family)
MYKNYDAEENNKIAVVKKEEKIEDVSLPKNEVEKKTMQAGKVIGGLNLNVRKQPSVNGEIVGTVRDGAAVQIIETVNEEWYHIASPSGYVMKKYVQV